MTENMLHIDISGMTCAACAARVTRVLNNRPEIASAYVDLASDRASISPAKDVKAGTAMQAALTAINEAGYAGFARGGSAEERQAQRAERQAALASEQRLLLMRSALAMVIAVPFFVAMGVEVFGKVEGHLITPWTQVLLASISQSVCAWPFYKGAWAAVRTRSANMDVLVVLGTITAFVLSLWHVLDGSAEHHGAPLYFEGSVAVIAFVLLGKVIERLARREAGAALSALDNLIPERVLVRQGGAEAAIAREAVEIGMHVIVKPGQVMPVDGLVLEGQAYLDESSITGESLPVSRGVGNSVQAGSAVSGGSLIVEVKAARDETRLARLARLIEDAGVQEAPALSLVDRISAVFVPGVIALAVLTFGGWWLAGAGVERALIIAASVLVVACPCALGLATPIALVAGASAGARQGLVLADHAGLEAGARLTHIAFDKTGTLTIGKPQLLAVAVEDMAEEDALALACRLAAHSDHPLDGALVQAARERGIFRDGVEAFSAQSGAGLAGRFEGKALGLGRAAFVAPDEAQSQRAQHLQAGLSEDQRVLPSALLSVDGVVVALFVFGDAVRADSAAAVRDIMALGVTPVMLSGDRQEVASAIARQLGIDDARGGLKPDDKMRALSGLRASGAVLGFVGDGLNDGPALRAAHLGIAMGTGTDVAKGAASVILARPDIRLVPLFIHLARRTRAAIRENLFLAFLFNGVAIPLAMAGKLSPALAGAAMALSSVSVVLNALRLSRWRG